MRTWNGREKKDRERQKTLESKDNSKNIFACIQIKRTMKNAINESLICITEFP